MTIDTFNPIFAKFETWTRYQIHKTKVVCGTKLTSSLHMRGSQISAFWRFTQHLTSQNGIFTWVSPKLVWGFKMWLGTPVNFSKTVGFWLCMWTSFGIMHVHHQQSQIIGVVLYLHISVKQSSSFMKFNREMQIFQWQHSTRPNANFWQFCHIKHSLWPQFGLNVVQCCRIACWWKSYDINGKLQKFKMADFHHFENN